MPVYQPSVNKKFLKEKRQIFLENFSLVLGWAKKH